jgi:uncharacterized protein
VPPAPDIRLVRTDIAGFAGFAERGVPGEAVKVTSWKDFRLKFGGYIAESYLAYAVRGFFATGGQTCYVVRIGAAATPPTISTLSLPAAAADQLITHLTEASASGQVRIKLESADVVSVGDVIAVGAPDATECVSVTGKVDDQTVMVQPLLASAHAQGDPVYAIPGSALQLEAAAGATRIQVVNAASFSGGDLVSIEGEGISELRVIAAPPAGAVLELAHPLAYRYGQGAVVRRYPAAFTVRAKSPGAWANRIKLRITPLRGDHAVQDFSLLVTVDASDDRAQPVEQEFYPHLSIDPNNASPTPIFAPQVIRDNSQLIEVNDNIPAGTMLLAGSGPVKKGKLQLEGGSDGAPGATAVATEDFLAALDALGQVDEVAILCCPDAVAQASPPLTPTPPPPPVSPCANQAAVADVASHAEHVKRLEAKGWSITAIQEQMIAQCARLRYRVAVLDTPMTPPTSAVPNAPVSLQPKAALAWLNAQPFYGASTRFAAVYYPWLKVPDDAGLEGLTRRIPPCGHVAGAYAYTDNNFGVQKPPANVELNFITDVDLTASDPEQGFLNELGITVIRPLPGRGIRVWGARSISADPDWRYIHTRRLMSMIEDSVEKASQWVVFQSHDADLRRMLTHSLDVFLEQIWRNGGLKGARPQEGYFVKCDETNNPQSSIDAGRLICQVGIAVAAPMEFLVFELRRSVEGPQVTEA